MKESGYSHLERKMFMMQVPQKMLTDENIKYDGGVLKLMIVGKDFFRKGGVEFPLNNLSTGEHSIRFKVWDVFNNSTEKTINFEVKDDATKVKNKTEKLIKKSKEKLN